MPTATQDPCPGLRQQETYLKAELSTIRSELRAATGTRREQLQIQLQNTLDELADVEGQLAANGCNPPPPPSLPIIRTPWAVLLCKFSDNLTEPYPRSFYEKLFTTSGAGTMNMVKFFSDMSHGRLDLSGSAVFGWYTLSQKHSDYTGSGPNPAGRQALVDWAKQAATNAGVQLANYFGVVVCMNVPTDLFGGGGIQAVCDSGSMQPSLLGQEMGHGYGLAHSRAEGSEADYQDPYDIMSTWSPYETPNADYTDVGPGLTAATMHNYGWLEETRVWSAVGEFDEAVRLRPLHHRSLPGYLAARIGPFHVEYRARESWDNNDAFPVVLVHRFQNNHSYVMSSTTGKKGLTAGDVFLWNSAFTRIRVNVELIDEANKSAYVRLRFGSLIHRIPRLGVEPLIGGVTSDGGGYVMIGGRIVPVPPHSPAMALVERAAALHEPEAFDDRGIGEQVQKLMQTRRSMPDGDTIQVPFRQPAKAPGARA